jgi:hypothetical protein
VAGLGSFCGKLYPFPRNEAQFAVKRLAIGLASLDRPYPLYSLDYGHPPSWLMVNSLSIPCGACFPAM